MIDYKEIEARWQEAWAKAKAFEVEPNDKPAVLVTAAFPYINNPLHMGHLRTYGIPDTYARYLRMRGNNVMYPMGFHATGTPLIGFAKRIAKGDKELVEQLKAFHMDEKDIARMSDLSFIADYFIKFQEKDFAAVGFGIDWRRKFISTDPLFSKMVEWQFGKLKEKGFLVQGSHPVGWCTNEGNAVGQHDTQGDAQPKIEELAAIKFKDAGSDVFFACSTYRPETIYGATNLFVGESVQYVIARINGHRFYLSKDAVTSLSQQIGIEVESQVTAKELLSKKAINPITKEELPILPGFFVKGDVGTGVVMSVPAHAPFDYAAVERLKASGYPVPPMEYKKVLEIEPLNGAVSVGRSIEDVVKGRIKVQNSETPALAYLGMLGSNHSSTDDALEFATKLVYREESRWGKMIVGDYKGMPEPKAREGLKSDLIKSNDAFLMYELANEDPVVCRCGTRVVVKVVNDQWFIDYGNRKWKDMAAAHLKNMTIRPEKYRKTFENLIEWLDLRAAERAQGLGTKFPYNPSHIIESLSDSTIYMSFYTFVHILKTNGTKPEQLKPELFDYVLNGTGDLGAVAASTGIDEVVLKKCRESVDYWYKNTSSHSAPDLVPNHLTMYIFNHVALLQSSYWPRQIVVSGMVNYEGEKMSKSLGNIVPIRDAVGKYGSDPMRFIELCGGELDAEIEFSSDAVSSVILRNQFLMDFVDKMNAMQAGELSQIDYWLYSKLHSKIKGATSAMDELQFRSAYTEVYYNSVSELRSYVDRGGNNQLAVRDFMDAITLMLAPVMPHYAEELWRRLGNSTMAVNEKWPVLDEKMINTGIEYCTQVADSTAEDISKSILLTSKMEGNKAKSLKTISIIVADQWKIDAYRTLVAEKDISKAIEKTRGTSKEMAAKFLSQFAKTVKMLPPIPEIKSEDICSAFISSKDQLSKRFSASVTVEMEKDSKSGRASRALPDKPSIDLVWG